MSDTSSSSGQPVGMASNSIIDDDGKILYAVVATSEDDILSEFTDPVVEFSNLQQVSRRILQTIKPEEKSSKMTLLYGNYMTHVHLEHSTIFMCITDKGFGRGQSFKFLDEIKTKWFEKFPYDKKSEQLPHKAVLKTFKSTIKDRMKYFNTDPDANKIKKLKNQIEDTKQEMIKNIDKVIERGERIDILVEKTSDLLDGSHRFAKKTKQLKYAAVGNNLKILLVLCLIFAGIILMIFLYFCGGVNCLLPLFRKSSD